MAVKSIKICICGGGSLAHTLTAVLGRQDNIELRLLTRNPNSWRKEVTINYRNSGYLKGGPDVISDNPRYSIAGADLILITIPSFAYPEYWKFIFPFIEKNAIVGALPGLGGFEWITHDYTGTIFSMQRTPYVSRTTEYGKSVFVSGVRKEVYIATRPAKKATSIAALLAPLLQLNVSPLPNYLNSVLAPTNPVFHSVRNYSLFHDTGHAGVFKKLPLFYEEWDDLASTCFLACDDEIRNLCNKLPIDMSGVSSIRTHYKAKTPVALTKAIRNIESLKGIAAPLRKNKEHWVPDYSHRFFTEDMLINLPLFLYLGDIFSVEMPVINKIAGWGIYSCNAHGVFAAYDAGDYARKAGVTSARDAVKFYSE